ncbi:hypothetical protein PanWU01x14_016030, partial [Parasponia andersonii]
LEISSANSLISNPSNLLAQLDMANMDSNLHALLAQNSACEGGGRNSLGSSSRLTLPMSVLSLRTSELPPALTTQTLLSSDYLDKRLMDTPHLNEPSSQRLKTFLKRPMDKMHAAYSE